MSQNKNRINAGLARAFLPCLLIGAGSLFAVSPAQAVEVKKSALVQPLKGNTLSPNDQLSLQYSLTRSDISLMKLSFNISLKGERYTASHSLKSKGLIKIFSDTKSKAFVEGQIGNGGLSPRKFQMTSEKKDKTRTAKLTWEKEQIVQDVTPVLSAGRTKSLQVVLSPELVDPLSGLLSMVVFDNPQSPCDKTIRVFEGRKIFDLSYSYQKADKIKKSDNGSFRGSTHICELKHTPIAGYSSKKMKRAAESNEVHILWVARIKSPTSDKSYLLPVKARISTKYGPIDVSLKKGKINGTKLRKAAIALK